MMQSLPPDWEKQAEFLRLRREFEQREMMRRATEPQLSGPDNVEPWYVEAVFGSTVLESAVIQTTESEVKRLGKILGFGSFGNSVTIRIHKSGE